MKATAANARVLGAQKGGWGSFKHRLMAELEIPQSEFDRWSVPDEWKWAFCKANGRTPFKTTITHP